MRIVLLSDIHLLTANLNNRKDDIVNSQWVKLNHVFEVARKMNAIVIQAGDFVDSPRSWILLKLLISFFNKYPTVPVYFILGQHDMYFRSTSLTIMGVLTRIFSNLTLLTESKPCIVEDVALVGQSYTKKSEEYSHIKGKFNILVVHKPISKHKLVYSSSTAKQFLSKHKKFDCILCGDIHRRFRITSGKRCIVNTASLVRKTHLDSSPGFYVLNTSKNTYKFYKLPVKDDVFMDVVEDDTYTDFLDEFVEKLKSKNKVFLNFTPKEKVLALIKEKKRYKRIKKLALELMVEDE